MLDTPMFAVSVKDSVALHGSSIGIYPNRPMYNNAQCKFMNHRKCLIAVDFYVSLFVSQLTWHHSAAAST